MWVGWELKQGGYKLAVQVVSWDFLGGILESFSERGPPL